MPIINWKPWSLSRMLEDDLDIPTLPLLSKMAAQGINLFETEKEFVAEAILPGIPEENVEITTNNGVVRVFAHKEENEEEKNKKRYFMSAINTSYNYSFKIPEGIDNNVEPTCEIENGVLKMRFQKLEQVPPKKLKITKAEKNNSSRDMELPIEE